MYHVLVTDIDGTLVDQTGLLPDLNVQALRRWVDDGRILVLATGRNLRITRQIAQTIDRDMFLILQDGSLLMHYPSQEVLCYHNLSQTLTQKAMKLFREISLSVLLYEPLPDGLTFFFCEHGPLSAGLNRSVQRHQGRYHQSSPVVLPKTPSKIVTIDTDEVTARYWPQLQEALPEARVLRTEAVHLGAWFLEVGPPAASKVTALGDLLHHLRQTKQTIDLRFNFDSVLAFGDAENDIDMLKAAGLGLAVKNASPRVKTAADQVIGSNTEAAVGQFILTNLYAPQTELLQIL